VVPVVVVPVVVVVVVVPVAVLVLVPVVVPVVVPASFSFEDGPPLPPQAIQSEPIRIGAAIHANGRRTRFKR
jgi:hypothetical protein